jgi:hypothetical protein
MAKQFISQRVRARKLVRRPRPSLLRRLGAMAGVLWVLIGWVEFGPKRPFAPPRAPAPLEAVIIAPAPQPDAPRAAPLPETPTPAAARVTTRRARPGVPLEGSGDHVGDDGLYVLSAAELAEISQAATH